MIKKTALIFSVLFLFFSCSTNNLIEEVIEKYDEGNKKIVHYYQKNKKGERTWIRETWFYKEGMKHLDGPIKDGLRNGVFESYYKSGSLLSKGEFVNGKREGKATVYHENGNINYEGFYKNGRECGIWKFYDENGNLYNEVNKN